MRYMIQMDDLLNCRIWKTVPMRQYNLSRYPLQTFLKGKDYRLKNQITENLILENDLVRYEFNDQGELISAYDKEIKKEFLVDPETFYPCMRTGQIIGMAMWIFFTGKLLLKMQKLQR